MKRGFISRKRHFNVLGPLFCGAILLFGAGKSDAQTSQDIDRAQLLQSQTQPPFAPGVSPNGVVDDHAVASPNDSDLGVQEILKRNEEYMPFTASVASPVYYTSNVALTNSGERGDVITAPVAAIFYQPRITKALYGLVDVRQQFFYYGTYHDFDFGSLDVEAGLSYVLPQFHNLILRGSYDFNRLTYSDRVLDEFYQNNSIILNAEVPIRLCRAAQISLGTDAAISVAADHQSPRRNDYDVYAGYSVFLTRSFSLDGSGRVVVRDYHQNNRTDVSEILSATANWHLTNWWTMSAIGSFARSDSNHDVYDYSVANVGGALSLSVKF